MAFGNPITSLPADAITPGTLGTGVVLPAGQLGGGALSAVFDLTGTIRTAATGARLELDSAGLRAYEPSGVQTVNVDATTGAVSLIGTLSSGDPGGRRIALLAGTFHAVKLYTGDVTESSPGALTQDTVGDLFLSPSFFVGDTGQHPFLTLARGVGISNTAQLLAELVNLTGPSGVELDSGPSSVKLTGNRAVIQAVHTAPAATATLTVDGLFGVDVSGSLTAGGVTVGRQVSGVGSVVFTSGTGVLTYGSLGFIPSVLILTAQLGTTPVILGLNGAPSTTAASIRAWTATVAAPSTVAAFTGTLAAVHWLACE